MVMGELLMCTVLLVDVACSSVKAGFRVKPLRYQKASGERHYEIESYLG